MHHTFLFEEGHWIATGIFLDNQNNQLQARGEMHTTHQNNTWLHESIMYVEVEQSTEFVNCSQITPFSKDKDTTVWKSYHSVLGTLEGKLILVSNTLISSYQSQNNFYSGTECFIMLDSDCYENKGLLFTEDGKVSSWLMRLIRSSY